MYLSLLKPEEKSLFLGLAYELASADGSYSNEEKLIIESYCNEMQIEFNKELMVNSIDEILKKIVEISDDRTKKIIIFEVIGLAMVDGTYAESEKSMILNMEKLFGIGNSFVKRCENVLYEYIQLQEKINKLILV